MTEMIALIQTVSQYREVLDRVTKLAEKDPDPDSPAGRELGVLSVLLQEQERKTFSLAPPNPIGAIRLRMEQLGLTPKDLVPLIGSRSKVSEVLAGKRPLSLPMIRSLHVGLGIPLESLIAEVSEGDLDSKIQWDRFPIKEMIKRQWIDVSPALKSKTLGFDVARQLMQGFLKPVGGLSAATVALHKTDRVRAGRTSDRFALTAWAAFIRRRAEQSKVYTSFNAAEWGIERVRELRSLSRFDVGPRLAIQFLLERGIVVVIERHLNQTRLDGAAMLRNDGTPVI